MKRRFNRLTGKSQWFKDRIFQEEEEPESNAQPGKPRSKKKKPDPSKQTAKIEGVMFVPNTNGKLKKILQEI